MPTNAEEIAFETLRTRCPSGGVHVVEKVTLVFRCTLPECNVEHRVDDRRCVKCGLRDAFIEEG